VLIDTGEWTEAEVLGLLRRADCLLSLTAAEGWGLGAFDAACQGTPVLITGHGGQLEWLGADHPGLLPFRTVPADHPDPALFEPGMTWAAADVDVAVEQLRALLRGDHDQLVRATERLAIDLPVRYSPAAVGAIAASRLPG
jgi:glycosyltransferase involved in cell wall biosynthesis